MKKPQILAGVLALALLLAVVAGSTHAQGPGPGGEVRSQATLMGTAFTYQGELKAGGEPVDDDCDMAFRLYDDLTGGSRVGSAITRTAPISGGLFTVVLDFGSGAFTGDARWLGIRVKCSGDGDFTTLTPRQALTPAPYALALPGLWPQQNTTSPNLIGGYNGNSITAGVVGGTIGGGGVSTSTNRVTDDYGTVGGGYGNRAGDDGGATSDAHHATVGGGYQNTASNSTATVGGGYQNTADGVHSTVGGGVYNGATGREATIGGGALNNASSDAATVGGGYENNASGGLATIGGGYDNNASGGSATVGGGNANRVTDDYGTVGGGYNNQAGDNAGTTSDALHATVGGGYGNVASQYEATVGGGYENTASGFRSTVGGGVWNGATGSWSTVAGGSFNIASGEDDTIGGGYLNRASGGLATIGGGYSNNASGGSATIGGGYQNTASADVAVVGGGLNNTASADCAVVSGGCFNTASYSATVPGGANNSADGDYSFAAGRRAKANHHGSFVWGDSTEGDVNSSSEDQFIVRANGGIWFGAVTTDFTPTIGSGVFISTSTGAYLSTGGAWTDGSDQGLKERFSPVDAREVLARLTDLPITTWNYKAEDPSIRHMGPVAQDFYATFGLGQDERHIASLDTSGVALAAIQALYEHSQGLEGENVALREQVTALREENAAQQAQIDDLGARVAALEGAPISSPPLLQSGLLPGAGLFIASLGLVWVTRRGSAPSLSKGDER